jgi:leucyl aminopeptidase
MNIRLIHTDWSSVECDALLIPLFEDDDFSGELGAELDAKLEGLLSEMKNSGEWKGQRGDVSVIYRPKDIPADRLILVGGGLREDYKPDVIRQIVQDAVHKFKAYSLRRFAVVRRSAGSPEKAGQAAVEGVVLGTHDSDDYKTENRSKTCLDEILLVTKTALPEAEMTAALRRGEILATATNMARALINEPGNRINPTILAECAKDIAERFGLEIEVLSEPEIEDKGMNALLAVARGSDEPARFIVLRHHGAEDSQAPPAVLIGKGVTFDSGGLSLKPPDAMEDMKADKAGACAVLGAMQAIAQLEVPRNVIGLIPAVENLPSGRAQRPGDVIRSLSGKTIEVLNTDAEGRLILADALHYALQFKPDYVVDIATLTGACIVALGKVRAALFSNDESLAERIQKASRDTGEKLWRMPLDKEYRKLLDSSIADIKNTGDRWGGAVTAAKFLQEFVGETPWGHLDIAGVDIVEDRDGRKSPTGFGVRTLSELVAAG